MSWSFDRGALLDTPYTGEDWQATIVSVAPSTPAAAAHALHRIQVLIARLLWSSSMCRQPPAKRGPVLSPRLHHVHLRLNPRAVIRAGALHLQRPLRLGPRHLHMNAGHPRAPRG